MYSRYEDLTSRTRKIYESPELQRYLNHLEGLVGREVSPREVVPHNVGLRIIEPENNGKTVRLADFEITSTMGFPHPMQVMRNFAIAGTLTYEGRVKSLQTIE